MSYKYYMYYIYIYIYLHIYILHVIYVEYDWMIGYAICRN